MEISNEKAKVSIITFRNKQKNRSIGGTINGLKQKYLIHIIAQKIVNK